MEIQLEKFRGKCGCMREHSISTKFIYIEQGATKKLSQVARDLRFPPGGWIVCDSNTRVYAANAANQLRTFLLEKEPVVELQATALHADEKAVAKLEELLPVSAKWMLAVGSGTIHDIVRYCAGKRGIPFLSYPTAATVDGFVSSVSAMTWDGFKKTLPGVAPLAVVADTAVFAAAPYRLTAAGIGDVLGKYTALADWRIANLLAGEAHCSRIESITKKAIEKVQMNLAGIRSSVPAAMEHLMTALLLSGVAMQMWGNSRPASGAEHHLSHLWEMEVLNPHIDALHGEKVGVGLLLAVGEYKRILDNRAGLRIQKDEAGLPHSYLKKWFGALYEDIVKENTPNPLGEVEPIRLEKNMDALCAIVAELPDPPGLADQMEQAGCCIRPEQIGLRSEIIQDSLNLSPYVRNRLTLMRLRKIIRI